MREQISSRRNPLLRSVHTLARDSAARRENNLIVCEGHRLLRDALDCGLTPQTVIVVPGAALPPLPPGVRLAEVSAEILQSLSTQVTPQGVMSLLPRPGSMTALRSDGRYILLDHVQDPGNVGTILRTAEAFGLNGVLLTEGCADPFSPKTLRAAMGAALRLPIGSWDALDSPEAPPLYALDMDGEDIRAAAPTACIAVIGSEGAGITPELAARCEKVLRIPMAGRAESLNAAVAASILMWEMSR